MESAWDQFVQTAREEFLDLRDVAQWTRAILRLSSAVLLAGLLGYERELEGKAAGLRTHMLVALGAAMIVLAPSLAGVGEADMTRVIQGVVTGVGFLGAGSILKKSDDHKIHGLTTAAGIWTTAAVGMAAGTGHLALAILGTAIALGVLSILGRVERGIDRRAEMNESRRS